MNESVKPKLIFVYNANSGVFNLMADVAHKIFSPQTYNCNLCAVTHSNFGMKKEWKEFLKTLDNPLEFLHADEFDSQYQFVKTALPAIFKVENGNLNLFVEAEAINHCESVNDLERLLATRLGG